MGDSEALTTYLEGVGMKDLIREMTLDLNDSRPDEPIGHLIKFLHTKYPKEAEAARISASNAGSSSLTTLMQADVDSEDSEPDDPEVPSNATAKP